MNRNSQDIILKYTVCLLYCLIFKMHRNSQDIILKYTVCLLYCLIFKMHRNLQEHARELMWGAVTSILRMRCLPCLKWLNTTFKNSAPPVNKKLRDRFH